MRVVASSLSEPQGRSESVGHAPEHRRLNDARVMKCVICKHGEVTSGTATVTLERDKTTLVIKGVPARVCTNCGEEYVDEDTTRQLLETA
jgi:YgiT-type zinc finger domain-containing protein